MARSKYKKVGQVDVYEKQKSGGPKWWVIAGIVIFVLYILSQS
jgi:hypothetical protein